MADDPLRGLAEAYALGALDAVERMRFEEHLAGCEGCRADVGREGSLLASLPKELAAVPPDRHVRDQVFDLADAPALPLDFGAYDWDEIVPGVKVHVAKEDPSRGMRACLVWAQPGARHPLHRHLGDENILVLQGAIRDERGTYGPGELCRSRKGSIHTEEALPGDDCVCYVVYYGDLEMIEDGPEA